jgi:hypothetical protein
MKTEADYLRFVVRLTTWDGLEGNALKDIRNDIHAMLQAPVVVGRGSLIARPSDDSDDLAWFQQLQRDVRQLMRPIIHFDEKVSGETIVRSVSYRAPETTTRKSVLQVVGGTVLLDVRGSRRDVFLEILCHVLVTLPLDKLRRCPGCGTPFFRSGRQTHCTPKCYNASYWSSLPTDQLERYREKQYEAGNWTRGARLRRLATKGRTGGTETPRPKHPTRKRTRQSKRGKRRA